MGSTGKRAKAVQKYLPAILTATVSERLGSGREPIETMMLFVQNCVIYNEDCGATAGGQAGPKVAAWRKGKAKASAKLVDGQAVIHLTRGVGEEPEVVTASSFPWPGRRLARAAEEVVSSASGAYFNALRCQALAQACADALGEVAKTAEALLASDPVAYRTT
eukprot:scaffold90033_cov25-Prasinocladus_malaysianus.AAC.1